MDDLFDDIFLAEGRFQAEGFKSGVDHAKQSGYEDGYNTGQDQGRKIGAELGFYLGFVATWRKLLETEGSHKGRKQKVMDSLVEMIESFPFDDPENQNLQDEVQKIRAKFKQVTSLLNVNAGAGVEQSGVSF